MSILDRARHAALTLPQVHTPKVAAAVVRAVTSSGSGGSGSSGGDATSHSPSSRSRGAARVRVATGMSVGSPGERYVPETANTGRTSGIVAAQHTAAPGAAAVALGAEVRERVVEFPEGGESVESGA